MGDLYGFDLADGLASGECPICYSLAVHVRRWLDAFRREGRRDAAARKRFFEGGGFCRRHAWLLHRLADSAVAVADLYGGLADRDLAHVDDLLSRRRPPKRPAAELRRRASCSACAEEAEALPRKAEFFLDLLESGAGRRRYEQSVGVCFPHLLALLDACPDGDELARYLLEDWRRRLAEVRGRLAEYDRKRDHRFAAERRDDEQRAGADALARYVGRPPGRRREP